MLQQCQFSEETACKCLDKMLHRLDPFSLLEDGPVRHIGADIITHSCRNTHTRWSKHVITTKTRHSYTTHEYSPEDVFHDQVYGAVLSTGFRLKHTKTVSENSCCFIDTKIIFHYHKLKNTWM